MPPTPALPPSASRHRDRDTGRVQQEPTLTNMSSLWAPLLVDHPETLGRELNLFDADVKLGDQRRSSQAWRPAVLEVIEDDVGGPPGGVV